MSALMALNGTGKNNTIGFMGLIRLKINLMSPIDFDLIKLYRYF